MSKSEKCAHSALSGAKCFYMPSIKGGGQRVVDGHFLRSEKKEKNKNVPIALIRDLTAGMIAASPPAPASI